MTLARNHRNPLRDKSRVKIRLPRGNPVYRKAERAPRRETERPSTNLRTDQLADLFRNLMPQPSALVSETATALPEATAFTASFR